MPVRGSGPIQSFPKARTPFKVSRTESFAKDFKSLPKEIQPRVERTILLLTQDPSYPSLRTKKMKGTKDIWEVSVSMSYRISYQLVGDRIILRRIGAHDILRTEARS
jgi:mRNA interferase RelE/StbE